MFIFYTCTIQQSLFYYSLSLYLFINNKRLSSFLTLGFATIFKPWPVIFLPVLWFRSKNFLIKTISYILPIAFVVSFYARVVSKTNFLNLFLGIAIYDSAGGWWGLSLFFNNFILHQLSKIIVITLTFLSAKLLKQLNIFNVAKITLLITYVFSFGLSIHYFLWLFPFILITKDSFIKYYLLFVGAFLILFAVFGGLNFNFNPPETPYLLYRLFSFLLWCFFLVWLVKEIRYLLKRWIVIS